MVTLSEKQFWAGIQPQLSVTLEWIHKNRNMAGVFHFKNVGPSSFMIAQGEFSWYCACSEQTLVRPHEFPLLHYRVLPPGEATRERFEVNPLTADLHEDHEGECRWNFRTLVQLEDLTGILKHEYSFDEALGLSYVRDYTAHSHSWWKTRIRWRNRWISIRYRLKLWWRALQKRIAEMDAYPRK